MKTNGFDWLAILLVVVGALTWGVIGVTGLTGEAVNIVAMALEPVFRPGPAQTVESLIYTLVGVAGIYLLYTAYKLARINRQLARAQRDRTAASTTSTPTATERSDSTGTENTGTDSYNSDS
ncbi:MULTISPECIES: DUF378 domain-containing protein [Halorussus]|uniref:DUF378 domain-containing protein n=1 Tax=Halorussus TaxID=1070314 RepID=UPI00209DCBA6|nr:DUF378 domain-containing protein [Halorussus vallis]USZ74191.1 DUF378 domain-containing protein [Halorussus vallis]